MDGWIDVQIIRHKTKVSLFKELERETFLLMMYTDRHTDILIYLNEDRLTEKLTDRYID